MFAISKVNSEGVKFYLKSTKRTKMVQDGRFKVFSKKETAEYWIKELKLDDCSVIFVNVEKKSKRTSSEPTTKKVFTTEDCVQGEQIDDESDSNFDPEYLFKTINEQCQNCKKKCKQSGKATILRCPDYKDNKIN